MRIILILVPFILWSFRINGQNINSQTSNAAFYEAVKEKQRQSAENLNSTDEEQISANPYLNREFRPGLIIKTNKTEFRDIPLRYNIFNNTMEFKQKETILEIIDPQTIDHILLDEKIFVYGPYKSARKIRLSYFQILTNGKFQLLKMYRVNRNGATSKQESSVFESTTPLYYLRYLRGTAHLIDSSKKLIQILQPISQEVIDRIQQNRITDYDENELIQLLDYINLTFEQSINRKN